MPHVHIKMCSVKESSKISLLSKGMSYDQNPSDIPLYWLLHKDLDGVFLTTGWDNPLDTNKLNK